MTFMVFQLRSYLARDGWPFHQHHLHSGTGRTVGMTPTPALCFAGARASTRQSSHRPQVGLSPLGRTHCDPPLLIDFDSPQDREVTSVSMSDFDDDTWTETTRMVPIESEPQPAKLPHALSQINGDGAQNFCHLGASITLGRSNEADIKLPHSLPKHIVIQRQGEECRVTDLGSSNGFFLNGLKVHSAVLRNGDTLQLGNILLSFQETTS